jgi:hypothetical protein
MSQTSTCALWEEQRPSSQDKEPKLRLSLEIRVTEDVTVICCKGRIAYGIEAGALSDEIAELLPQTRQLVIDLSGVEMIDGAGLGELVSVAVTAQTPVLSHAGCSQRSHPPITGAYQLDLGFRSSSHLGCSHPRIPRTSGVTIQTRVAR